jgi:hypothetical protein
MQYSSSQRLLKLFSQAIDGRLELLPRSLRQIRQNHPRPHRTPHRPPALQRRPDVSNNLGPPHQLLQKPNRRRHDASRQIEQNLPLQIITTLCNHRQEIVLKLHRHRQQFPISQRTRHHQHPLTPLQRSRRPQRKRRGLGQIQGRQVFCAQMFHLPLHGQLCLQTGQPVTPIE